jgi:drug/metabolite transporter (DMT)-like permease
MRPDQQIATSLVAPARDLSGYGLVAGSFVLIGLSGTLVSWATAPSSVLLVMRLGIASAVLGLVFARQRPLRGILRRGLWPSLLLMSAFDSGALLAYFFAIRTTGVAIATFLLFMQPLWVALLAPRFLKTPTEKVVIVALGAALVGLVVILGPTLLGGGVSVSVVGLAAGLTAGCCYAFFLLIVKGLTRKVPSTTIVLCECTLDTLFVLPLALWQTTAATVRIEAHDLLAMLILGLVCTLAYWMWVDGVARIRVQHSAILGFLTPVVAPLLAWLFLGQGVTLAVAVGGAFIVAGGLLVVLFGREQTECEAPLQVTAGKDIPLADLAAKETICG